MAEERSYRVAIIGAGPAGIAAAVQLKHRGIEPLVFESTRIGGLLINANRVENYPGFPNGVNGPAIARLFQRHLQKLAITIRQKAVRRVSFSRKLFHIKTSAGNFNVEFLVAASGTRAKRMTDCHIARDMRGRIYYEVYPIRNLVNKKVTVIGSGDAAFDYALNLARKNRVTIINRSRRVKCLPVLWNRAAKNKNIKYIPQTRVLSVMPAGKMMGLHCSNDKVIIADRLLVAIGREPNLDFFNEGIHKDKRKLVRQKKLYIIGDAGHGRLRQTAIAVGDGIRTATEIAERMTRVQGS